MDLFVANLSLVKKCFVTPKQFQQKNWYQLCGYILTRKINGLL